MESERTGRDVLTFPVSVLVFHEYYFISKFKWKSDERWDCFCLCLFWYPTSLLANCWACLFWSIFGFPWSKPLPWENWSALELNSSLSVLPVQMFWSRLVCQAARALDLRSAMIFFVGKDNGFILDPDATRSLRTQVRDWQVLVGSNIPKDLGLGQHVLFCKPGCCVLLLVVHSKCVYTRGGYTNDVYNRYD